MISQHIMHFEPLLRLTAFFGVFGAIALWETLAPRRRRTLRRLARWPHNLGLLVVDTMTVRLLAPGAAIAVAVAGEANGWGLLNAALSLPLWAAALVAVLRRMRRADARDRVARTFMFGPRLFG